LDDSTARGADAPVYGFRPRMIGGEIAFRLGGDSLEWLSGSHQGRVAYAMIRRVRLGFRPTTFMGRRFTAEIFPRTGGRVEIASLSVRSLGGNTDQGPAYRAFVAELHRRIVQAGGDCRFEAGLAAWRWWPSLVISLAFAAGILFIAGQALWQGQFASAALVAAIGALLAWQMVPLVTRNRPRAYRPDAIPADVMP
jgi:hypothetical protein